MTVNMALQGWNLSKECLILRGLSNSVSKLCKPDCKIPNCFTQVDRPAVRARTSNIKDLWQRGLLQLYSTSSLQVRQDEYEHPNLAKRWTCYPTWSSSNIFSVSSKLMVAGRGSDLVVLAKQWTYLWFVGTSRGSIAPLVSLAIA